MTVREIQELVEQWAPHHIAWDQDNVGLQCGDPDSVVRRILVTLDVTEPVALEARRTRARLVISHHPLIFRPLRTVSRSSSTARTLESLIQGRVALLAVHTNLDFSRQGTSFALAAALGLERPEFLHRPYMITRKVITFVPQEHVDRVARAMAQAGAGVIGNYEECSFRSEGVGTFRGNARSRPAVGIPLRLERVDEVRLEMEAPRWRTEEIVRALRAAHPYEEPAYDIVPTETASREYGLGVIGALRRPQSLRGFLRLAKRRLGIGALRFAGDLERPVSRIAVCGGSGAALLDEAVAAGADLFLTADIKYHTFQDAAGRIALVDAGHAETEIPVVPALAARLRHELRRRGARIQVAAAVTRTNPIQYI